MSDRLETIRERWAKATPGPWKAKCYRDWQPVVTANTEHEDDRPLVVAPTDGNGRGTQDEQNVEAIAAAPEDIAYLIAEVERLRAPIYRATAMDDGTLKDIEIVPGGIVQIEDEPTGNDVMLDIESVGEGAP